MIKCILHIKIEYEITMLPIYNYFDFTIKCMMYTIWNTKKKLQIKRFSKIVSFKQCLKGC